MCRPWRCCPGGVAGRCLQETRRHKVQAPPPAARGCPCCLPHSEPSALPGLIPSPHLCNGRRRPLRAQHPGHVLQRGRRRELELPRLVGAAADQKVSLDGTQVAQHLRELVAGLVHLRESVLGALQGQAVGTQAPRAPCRWQPLLRPRHHAMCCRWVQARRFLEVSLNERGEGKSDRRPLS